MGGETANMSPPYWGQTVSEKVQLHDMGDWNGRIPVSERVSSVT